MSIFYVHGFASCADANANKKKELENIFPMEKVYLLNYDSSLCYEKISKV